MGESAAQEDGPQQERGSRKVRAVTLHSQLCPRAHQHAATALQVCIIHSTRYLEIQWCGMQCAVWLYMRYSHVRPSQSHVQLPAPVDPAARLTLVQRALQESGLEGMPPQLGPPPAAPAASDGRVQPPALTPQEPSTLLGFSYSAGGGRDGAPYARSTADGPAPVRPAPAAVGSLPIPSAWCTQLLNAVLCKANLTPMWRCWSLCAISAMLVAYPAAQVTKELVSGAADSCGSAAGVLLLYVML